MSFLGPESQNVSNTSGEDRTQPLPDSVLSGEVRGGFLSRCSNPDCSTGWMHLLRRRTVPIFEDGWTCSQGCTQRRVEQALRRELEGRSQETRLYRHRIPLGLVMLEQQWIDAGQLRRAIEAQRRAGEGRIGGWLVQQEGVSEQLVARALGLQWSCPVVSLPFHDGVAMAPALPRLFVDAFGALPLRKASERLLYLGFEDRPDPVVAFAMERMLDMRVEAVLVPDSEFRQAHTRILSVPFPRVELLEVSSEAQLGRALSRVIEKVKPVQARLVRLHDFLWLRMWRKSASTLLHDAGSIEDVICALTQELGRGSRSKIEV
jgi:hypothetical protein